ncbi:uncharacterized protein LOC141595114 [Silene latifolia]|uniref:uncharacterized protein LOC141595114 n=1 Tax=Silene latifolia TaxID=37657 RepID=UPI003D77300C
MVAQQALSTVDNLKTRGFHMANRCCLCQHQEETHVHLFFNCSYTNQVWSSILQWMKISRPSKNLKQELSYFDVGGTKWRMYWFHISLAATVYQVCLGRNRHIFRGECKRLDAIINKIKFVAAIRILMINHRARLSLVLDALNS